jgi:hypothetical protein
MKRIVLVGAVFVLFAAATARESLPQLGTRFHALPDDSGKEQVEAACLPCHSADILVQQRLTDKQWAANVDKMIRWGAVVADADKPKIALYLSKNFGPENKFTPMRVLPPR